MSEERAEYNAEQDLPKTVDEYHIRRLGTERYEVYRLPGGEVGGAEVHCCECKTFTDAGLIAKALELVAALDDRQTQESTRVITFGDGSEFIIKIKPPTGGESQ
jgi:hypothetical protein